MDQRSPGAIPRQVLLGDWVELEWAELVARLLALLDAEEKELLPLLGREAARGIVQEIRYLRGRAVELGRMPRSRGAVNAFLAEIRAHLQRAQQLGFRSIDA